MVIEYSSVVKCLSGIYKALDLILNSISAKGFVVTY